jgi:hypothetical protein
MATVGTQHTTVHSSKRLEVFEAIEQVLDTVMADQWIEPAPGVLTPRQRERLTEQQDNVCRAVDGLIAALIFTRAVDDLHGAGDSLWAAGVALAGGVDDGDRLSNLLQLRGLASNPMACQRLVVEVADRYVAAFPDLQERITLLGGVGGSPQVGT